MLLRGYLPMLVLVSDVLYVILMSPTLKIYNLFSILLIYFGLLQPLSEKWPNFGLGRRAYRPTETDCRGQEPFFSAR